MNTQKYRRVGRDWTSFGLTPFYGSRNTLLHFTNYLSLLQIHYYTKYLYYYITIELFRILIFVKKSIWITYHTDSYEHYKYSYVRFPAKKKISDYL